MKRPFFILGFALALCGVASAPALTAPVAAPVRTAPATPAPAATTSAPFGCEARTPNVCYFRIFYTRGDRIVILPSGMKNKVPGVTIGGGYCMTLGKTPVYKCARKVIGDKYNS